MTKRRAVMNWSGGKDSAFALFKALERDDIEVTTLLTTVSSLYNRISIHGVRCDLLEAQAEALGLPLIKISLPEEPDMATYDKLMRDAMTFLKGQGIEVAIFGDIFLEDLRAYREHKLRELSIEGIFPLWKEPTDQLIRDFMAKGFKTLTVCVDKRYLGKSFVGRVMDETFLSELPSNVDPCGENGEFHTFVFEGPIFKKPLPVVVGEIVERNYRKPNSKQSSKKEGHSYLDKHDHLEANNLGFWYCDLLKADEKPKEQHYA